MGVALAYHLAEEGETNVMLIEKGELTSGSTWHAAGQCPSLVGNYNLAKIHDYGNRLYPTLEEKTGQVCELACYRRHSHRAPASRP